MVAVAAAPASPAASWQARNRSYSERFYGRFERQITLDREVDDNAVQATFKNGVLTVTVPKSARAFERSKRIPINAVKTEGKSH